MPDTWEPRTDLFDRDSAEVTDSMIEGPPLSDELVAAAEAILGLRLPRSYLALMKVCNGGALKAGLGCPTRVPTSWAPDHVSPREINGIPAVGEVDIDDPYWCGDGILMTRYMTREWGLPEHLVLLTGDGHDWIALDYRASGPEGEPSVAWIDVEVGQELQLAPTFAAFVDSLRVFEVDDDPVGTFFFPGGERSDEEIAQQYVVENARLARTRDEEPDEWASFHIGNLIFSGQVEEAWTILLLAISSIDDEAELNLLGAGHLENIVRDHGPQFIDRIEAEAARSERFRRALLGVWAFESPVRERIDALIADERDEDGRR